MLTQITLETADTPDRPVVQVGKDTDLSTKLVHSMKTSNEYMWFRSGEVYLVIYIMQALPPEVREHILFAHAISGCDMV